MIVTDINIIRTLNGAYMELPSSVCAIKPHLCDAIQVNQLDKHVIVTNLKPFSKIFFNLLHCNGSPWLEIKQLILEDDSFC